MVTPYDLYQPTQFANDAEKRNFARTVNLKRRHLSREGRNQVIVAMRKDGASYRQIAEATGVDVSTAHKVVNDSGVGFPTPELPGKTTGKDGKVYPAKKRKLTATRARVEPPFTP